MMRLLERYKAALTFGLMVVVGASLQFWPSSWPPNLGWTGEVRKMLADALMVGGILGASVDYFLKAALVRDVGSIFIGWALPQEVRNYIRDVSQTAIVRRNTTIEYRFAMDGKHVVVDTTIRSDVFNYGTGSIRYQSLLGLDRIENPECESVRLTLTKQSKATVFDHNAFTRKKLYKHEGHSHRWRGPKCLLWPQDATEPGLRPGCTTSWTMRRRMPADYTTIEAVGIATLGMTVTIDAPPELHAFCKDADNCIHAEGSNEWHFPGLFMSGQHVRLYWRPREG